MDVTRPVARDLWIHQTAVGALAHGRLAVAVGRLGLELPVKPEFGPAQRLPPGL